jgi:hypothetical protein
MVDNPSALFVYRKVAGRVKNDFWLPLISERIAIMYLTY